MAIPLGMDAAFRDAMRNLRRNRPQQEIAVDYTFYDYLELAPGASPARIEAAYAQLLQRLGFGESEAGQDLSGLVRMIHAAHEVLSDPITRQRYDAELAREAAAADAELKLALDQQTAWSRRSQDAPASLAVVFGGLAA